MKILITTDLFTTDTNGVVTSVKNLHDELSKKGHQVYILTISDSIHSHRDNYTYYIRSMPFAIYPDVRMPVSYHHRLIKELIDWNPDIIHSQCEFFSFQFAQYISKNTGAPIVHTYHTMYEQYVKYLIPSQRVGNKVVKVVSKNRLRGVKKVIAPTHKVETALYNYGITADIAVVPSGISLEQHRLRLSDAERNIKRNSLGIKDDDTVLVNLGRLGHEKNIDELLKNGNIKLEIDLKPALSGEKLDLRILRDFEEVKNKEFKNSLDKLLPQKLIPVVLEKTKINPYKRVNEITKEERAKIVKTLKHFEISINGVRPIEEAIITSGGISIKEINPKTMESKIVNGLYFAGEIIDVDSYTGGFNLQIAWSTGYTAGL